MYTYINIRKMKYRLKRPAAAHFLTSAKQSNVQLKTITHTLSSLKCFFFFSLPAIFLLHPFYFKNPNTVFSLSLNSLPYPFELHFQNS